MTTMMIYSFLLCYLLSEMFYMHIYARQGRTVQIIYHVFGFGIRIIHSIILLPGHMSLDNSSNFQTFLQLSTKIEMKLPWDMRFCVLNHCCLILFSFFRYLFLFIFQVKSIEINSFSFNKQQEEREKYTSYSQQINCWIAYISHFISVCLKITSKHRILMIFNLQIQCSCVFLLIGF